VRKPSCYNYKDTKPKDTDRVTRAMLVTLWLPRGEYQIEATSTHTLSSPDHISKAKAGPT